MTENCNNMLSNDISNHESQLISNIPQPVTTANNISKVDENKRLRTDIGVVKETVKTKIVK